MKNDSRYVPILKGKMGEFQALSEVSQTQRQQMTPLLEVIDIPWDYQEDKPKSTAEEHLNLFVSKVVKFWGTKNPVYIDLPDSIYPQKVNSKVSITFLFDALLKESVQAIPVVGFDRPAEYIDAATQIIHSSKRGCCLRLRQPDFNVRLLGTKIPEVLKKIDLNPNDIDLLLDFEEVPPNENTLFTLLQLLLQVLPFLSDWRSVIFVGSSFPVDLRGMPGNSVTKIPRIEWMAWNRLIHDGGQIDRLPTFGDYAISNPISADIDPSRMNMSANLRYTSDEEWLVLKGVGVKKEGYDQFIDLCQQLIIMKEYKGAAFSAGDQIIADCAAKKTRGPGNATTWRKIGVNHHLLIVMEQLCKISAA